MEVPGLAAAKDEAAVATPGRGDHEAKAATASAQADVAKVGFEGMAR